MEGINETHTKKSKEILNRKTKTRTKSKILPSGDLVEQTVITEVTETFSSPSCASGDNVAMKKLSVEHETYDNDNENTEITQGINSKNKTKGRKYEKNEKLKGNSVMPYQTLGKNQQHIWKLKY